MEQAGPQLLRHWIDRAAARDPDKAFIIAADDGRTLTYGQLRELTRPDRDLSAGPGRRRQRPRCAALQQFDRASGGLFRRAGLWRDHLHGPCRDEPQPARQHPAALKPRMVLCEDGLGLDDMLKAVSAPCLPLGAWDDRRGDSFFAAVNALRAERCRRRRRPGRQRRDPVHLGHQRAAEGRGAELPRASVQRRADRRRLRADGDRIASTISARSTGARRRP